MSKDKIIKSYKLKNGEVRYMFRLYLGVDSLTGKAMSTTRRGFKSKVEAQDALAELRVQVNNGTYKKRAVETYRDLYNIWIEVYEDTVQDSTFLKTSRIFRNHILPDMGDYKIDRIDAATCQMHVNQWAKKLKRFTMVKSYAAMVITFAMQRGIIDKNPFDLVRNPIVKKRISLEDEDERGNFYTREQLIKLLDCFKKENNLRRYTFFHLLAFSGMRKGEAFALTWRDVNFSNNQIRINKAVARSEKGLYLGPTKNGTARTITMDNQSMELLKNWKEKQAAEFSELGFNTSKRNQLVFANTKNDLQDPNKTYPWLKRVLDKYDLDPITTHGLRHTHCSLLFEAKAPLKEVQVRLGHRDVKTTLDIYTHVTAEARASTVKKFDDYLRD